MDQFVAAANQMAVAAESGDMGQVGPAMQALGKSCKGCHDDYRITK
jgi:cytochrome c556